MRPVALCPLALTLSLAACCLSATNEGTASTAGTATTSGTAAGTSGTSSSTTTGGTTGTQPGPCGPGTSWVGDTCVTSCTTPASAGLGNTLPCLLSDGGLGNCSAGTCLSPVDADNCGALGLVCPPPAVCVLDHDTPFCNGLDCGAACPNPAQTCVYGSGCTLTSCTDQTDNQSCALSQEQPGFCCGGVCHVSPVPGSGTAIDPLNCGGCGITCGDGTACTGTGCEPTQACVSDAVFPAHCRLSTGALGDCCGGTCVTTLTGCAVASCTGAMTGATCEVAADHAAGNCCGDLCADLTADPANCGNCGLSCAPGERCAGGLCQAFVDCSKGGIIGFPQPDCLFDAGAIGACCGSACRDLVNDSASCGGCDVICPTGSTCSSGNCVDPDGGLPDCADCTLEGCCPNGSACVPENDCVSTTCDGTRSFCAFDGGLGNCCGTVCQPGGLGCGASCPAGTISALPYANGCIALDGGPACGPGLVSQCPSGTICTADQECDPLATCASPSVQTIFGDCFAGQAGGLCCGDTCTSPDQDADNCGACGVVCPSGLCAPEPSGSYGICLPAGPTDDCSLSCGPGSVCLNGQCLTGLCDTNLPFCLAENDSIGLCCPNGACAHPLDDPQNCGLCGNACGAGASCVNGSCTNYPSCGLGRMYTYCDVDAGPDHICCPGAGCTDIATDPTNCGHCGTVCLPGQVCANGGCQNG